MTDLSSQPRRAKPRIPKTKAPSKVPPRQSLLGGFGDLVWGDFQKKVAGAIAVAMIAVLVFIASGGWAWLKRNAASYVAEVIAAELASGQGAVVSAVDQRISGALDRKAGTVLAGSISLNADNISQVVYLYLPPGHSGRLHVDVDRIAEGEKVVLISPSGLPMSFPEEKVYGPIDLAILIGRDADIQAAIVSEVSAPELEGDLKYVVPITFRLTWANQEAAEISENEFKSSARIEYVSLVSPPFDTLLQ